MTTDYGNRLREAREFAGLTQKQAEKKTGIAQSTISTAERLGNGSADTPVYADAYGVAALWLATGNGSMKVVSGIGQLQHRLIDADPETKKMVELALMSDMDLEQTGLTPSLKNLIGFVKNQIREELRDAAAGEK